MRNASLDNECDILSKNRSKDWTKTSSLQLFEKNDSGEGRKAETSSEVPETFILVKIAESNSEIKHRNINQLKTTSKLLCFSLT